MHPIFKSLKDAIKSQATEPTISEPVVTHKKPPVHSDTIAPKDGKHKPTTGYTNEVKSLDELRERCTTYSNTVNIPMTAAKHLKILSNLRYIDKDVWKETPKDVRNIVYIAHKSTYATIKWLLEQRKLAFPLPRGKMPLYTRLETVLEASLAGQPLTSAHYKEQQNEEREQHSPRQTA